MIKANANLYLNAWPQSRDISTSGFHDHWNLSFGSSKNGYWFGPSLPKPTGLLSAITLGSTSTLNYKFPTCLRYDD